MRDPGPYLTRERMLDAANQFIGVTAEAARNDLREIEAMIFGHPAGYAQEQAFRCAVRRLEAIIAETKEVSGERS